MEEQWIVDRSTLREVWLEHPDWSKRTLAEAVGRSKPWVKKWLKRIRDHPLDDQEVWYGQSRAEHAWQSRTLRANSCGPI